jgi:serine protease Do
MQGEQREKVKTMQQALRQGKQGLSWFGGAAVAVSMTLASAVPMAQAQQVPSSREQIQLSFSQVVRQAAPAVVNIYTRKVVRARSLPPIFQDPRFQFFFGNRLPQGLPQQRVENALGSGVLIESDGVVVTNNHVIEGADEITVVLQDRREFQAELVGSDERTDLAVLRLKDAPSDLPILPLGSMDALEVGDLVLAIGNPFGVGQTVTSGIVSALGRHTSGTSYNAYIQTDAAINPGNSGGALVTMDGHLAGINSAIYTRDGGYMGIGFAIPADMVQTVTQALLNGGKVIRAWAGITAQPVGQDIATSLGFDRPGGLLVNGVAPDSPGDRAGLHVGDVIIAFDGEVLANPVDFRYRMGTKTLGSTAKLSVLRGEEMMALHMPLEAPPEEPPRDTTELVGRQPLSGTVVANLNPALAEEIEQPYAPGQVVVTAVKRTGLAARVGVEAGDVIREVNGKRITSVSDLPPLLSQSRSNWRIVLVRKGQIVTLRI